MATHNSDAAAHGHGGHHDHGADHGGGGHGGGGHSDGGHGGHGEWFADLSTPGVHLASHTDVINTAALGRWLVAILVSLAVVLVALFAYFDNYTTRLRAGQIMKADGTPVQGIEILTNSEANAVKASAEAALGVKEGKVVADPAYRYQVFDAKSGKVSVPLDKAMDKVVQKYGPAAK